MAMLRRGALLIVWLAIGLTTCRGDDLSKTVETKYGSVRGYKAVDGDYFAFLGIPYAAPPTGSNRFKAPLPPEPWKDTFEANRTVVCPQKGYGDEDCLIVNVFTPMVTNVLHPVLFYIHGGSFIMGVGPTKGVQPLINESLVVVTINYRLGALGFLCLGTPEAPGNAGLKDQVAALRWVRDNIRNFSGDSNAVTIYGMSAGAASVELLVLSKLTRGLFKRAVAESGSASAVWVTNAEPIATAEEVARWFHVDNRGNIVSELIKFYTNVSADKLSKTNFDYYSSLYNGTMGFTACVERKIQDVQPFLTEAPYDILVKKNFAEVPIMFIYSTTEGLHLRSEEFYTTDIVEKMNKNFIEFVPGDLCFNSTNEKLRVANDIKSLYFGKYAVGENINNYLDFFGDYLIMAPLINSTEFHAKKGKPVYLLEFGYKGKLGSYDAYFDEDVDSAGHGDFIKHAILTRDINNFADEMTVRRVSKLIANFAKFSNPTPTNDQLLPIPWPRVRPRNLHYMYLDKEFEVREKPFERRKDFWDELYSKFRIQITPVDPKICCRCGCQTGCNERYMCKTGRTML